MKTEVKADNNLKDKIIAILESRKLSYETLVSYLGLTTEELDKAFSENTLEIRTLELISKELRIPLYSFFRDPDSTFNYYGESDKYYNTHIWAPNEINHQVEIETLKKEMHKLKVELANKDLIIQTLEEELKTKLR
jgi:transcriptional regulator with XRE-family HTH domain